MTNQHDGKMIEGLQETVERVAARQAIDELGDSVPFIEVFKRAEVIRDEIKKSMPTGSDYFRFLNPECADEYDHDQIAEFEPED